MPAFHRRRGSSMAIRGMGAAGRLAGRRAARLRVPAGTCLGRTAGARARAALLRVVLACGAAGAAGTAGAGTAGAGPAGAAELPMLREIAAAPDPHELEATV